MIFEAAASQHELPLRVGTYCIMSTAWLEERLYDEWQQRFHVEREIVRLRSDYQEIVIFESTSHGRVLMLDGVVQITEADEFVYQEMLSHVPIVAHGTARRILIIGAGDGGVLRRVLEHATIEQVTLVEIDSEVVRLSREFLPRISGSAWDDPRARLVIGDGVEFVAAASSGSFDIIIVDSTDPAGVGTVLFTDTFYAEAARVLDNGGVIVNQCGVPFMQPDEFRTTSIRRSRHFDHVSAYVAAVPTYIGGLMTLGIAWSGRDRIDQDAGTARTRASRAGILGKTGYWSPEIHEACFALPPYIGRHLQGDNRGR